MSRFPPGDYDEDGYGVDAPNLHGNSGAAHSVNQESPDYDAVYELRKVVDEITRGRIPMPQRRGPRF